MAFHHGNELRVEHSQAPISVREQQTCGAHATDPWAHPAVGVARISDYSRSQCHLCRRTWLHLRSFGRRPRGSPEATSCILGRQRPRPQIPSRTGKTPWQGAHSSRRERGGIETAPADQISNLGCRGHLPPGPEGFQREGFSWRGIQWRHVRHGSHDLRHPPPKLWSRPLDSCPSAIACLLCCRFRFSLRLLDHLPNEN